MPELTITEAAIVGMDLAMFRLELELLRHQRDGLESALADARRAQERDAEERAELRRMLSQAMRMLAPGPETPPTVTRSRGRRRWWPWGKRPEH